MEGSASCIGDDGSGDCGSDDGCCCCCCCNSGGGCTAQGGAMDTHYTNVNFTAQMSIIKEIWEQWSELQQILALYSLLRSSSTQNSTAHLMMANMIYAHHNSEYTHHLYQQANDPVWVASMEVKCMEEASLELQAEENDECGRRESRSSSDGRRESGASGERRESEAGDDSVEFVAMSNRQVRESVSSDDKRDGDAILSVGCEEAGEGTGNERRRESRDSITSTGERRESATSNGGGGGDRRESGGSGLSSEERRDSGESFIGDRRERSGSFRQGLLRDGKRDVTECYDASTEEDKTTTAAAAEVPFIETLNELLLHLPLLHTNNTDTKIVYLAVIAKVVCISLRLYNARRDAEVSCVVSAKARQLVTFAMLHPGVTLQERKSLMACLHSLNAAGGRDGTDGTSAEAQQKWSDLEGGSEDLSRSGDDSSQYRGRGGGSDPGGGGGDTTCGGPPIIRDVGTWLKSLRLHKYDWLLRGLDYDQLLSLDDERLEAKGVTKGARHKLLLSIARLGQRRQQLHSVEKELQRGGLVSVEAAVAQLKALVITPMPPPPPLDPPTDTEGNTTTVTHEGDRTASSQLSGLAPTAGGSGEDAVENSGGVGFTLEEVVAVDKEKDATSDQDLPALFTRVLGKVVSAVAMGCGLPPASGPPLFLPGSGPNTASSNASSLLLSVLGLVDKCLQHDSFRAHHKRLWLWRSQLMLPSEQARIVGYGGGVTGPGGLPGRHHRNRRWSHQLEYQQHTQQLQQHLLQQQLQQHYQQQQQYQQQLMMGAGMGGLGQLNVIGCMNPCVSPGGAAGRRMFRPPHVMATPSQYPPLWNFLTTAAGGGSGVRSGYGGGSSNLVPPPAPSLLSPQPFMGKRPSLQEPPCQLRPHVSVQRTRSAPSRPHQPHPCTRSVSPGHTPPPPQLQASPPPPHARRASHPNTALTGVGLLQVHTAADAPSVAGTEGAVSSEDDITDRLESLCLSVTQHALE